MISSNITTFTPPNDGSTERRLPRKPFGRHAFRYACVPAIFLLAACSCLAGETPQVEAKRIMQKIESRFENVKSLSYTAERTIRSPAGSTRETWSFSYAEPGHFRIECRQPVERTLVAGRDTFWEYVPAVRKVMKTDLSTMADDARRGLLAGILARVAVDGVRVGKCEELSARAVSVSRVSTTGSVVRIEGAKPRYVMELDTERLVLKRSEIYDDAGECLMRTAASDFAEIAPGLWYPGEIRLECKTDKGIATSEVRLRGIEANKPQPEGSFDFKVPRGVTVGTVGKPAK